MLRSFKAGAFRAVPGGGISFQTAGGSEGELAPILSALLQAAPDATTASGAALARAVLAATERLDASKSPDPSQILAFAGEYLQPKISDLLDDSLVSLASCSEGRAGSIRCGLRALAQASYGPLLSYLELEQPSDEDRRRQAVAVYREISRQLADIDPLSQTPLLFNVGPGATLLTRYSGGKPTVHLTLIDKYGVAYRFGKRRSGQVGVFVGGFLDAIVRTAANAKDTQPFWLQGITGGWRELDGDFPIGLEAYVASALPYDFKHVKGEASVAAGLNLVVPADIVFSE
jgi:hypothetical protein